MRAELEIVLQDYSALSKKDPRKSAADFYLCNTTLAKKIIKDFDLDVTTKENFNDFILTFEFFVKSGFALMAGYVDSVCLSFKNHKYNMDHMKYMYDARFAGAVIAYTLLPS